MLGLYAYLTSYLLIAAIHTRNGTNNEWALEIEEVN